MRILHTSDWHLGSHLYGRKRYEEYESFLTWLIEVIDKENIDVLLIAGDIFDTTAPSHRAQEIYYSFLRRMAASACQHIVIIAGNHDSPSFVNAPKELLRCLDVHVIGHASHQLDDEVLVLRNDEDIPELIVCAVPYLRDRDIRVSEVRESLEDKEQKLLEGIRHHYASVASLAESKRQELGIDIPIIGMGHLFAAGGQTIDGDGVRELYVGSLAHVHASIFPSSFDYTALGHLHIPQKINDLETIRYSGSPLPMGFGEAGQTKSICLVEFQGTTPNVKLLEVPCFQKLERIKGDWPTLSHRLLELSRAASDIWLEVIYDGSDMIPDLRERLDTLVKNSPVEILRVKNHRILTQVLGQLDEEESLTDLDHTEVFKRCLALHNIPVFQHAELLKLHGETLLSLYEDDPKAQ